MLQRFLCHSGIEEQSCNEASCFQIGGVVLEDVLKSQSQLCGCLHFLHVVQHYSHAGEGSDGFFLIPCVKIRQLVSIERRPVIIFAYKFIADQRCDQIEKVILSGCQDHIFLLEFQAGGVFRIALQSKIDVQEMMRFIIALTAVRIQRRQHPDRFFVLSGSGQGEDQSFCDPAVEIGYGVLFVECRIDLCCILIFSLQVVSSCQHDFCAGPARILFGNGRKQFFQIFFCLRCFSLQEQQIDLPQTDGKRRFFFCDLFVFLQDFFRIGNICCHD